MPGILLEQPVLNSRSCFPEACRLAAQNPLNDVLHVCRILALQLFVLFFLAFDLDLGRGGDVRGELLFGIALALPFACNFLVRRAIFLFVDGVTFEAAALACQAFGCGFIDGKGTGCQAEQAQDGKGWNGVHWIVPLCFGYQALSAVSR